MSTPTTVPPAATTPTAPVGDPFVGGRRIVQYLVDIVLTWIVPAGVALAVGLRVGSAHGRVTGGAGWLVDLGLWALGIVMWLVVLVLVPALTDRTPGMMLLGLRVVRADDGGSPRTVAHLLRAVCLIVDGLVFGVVGLVTMFATARRQRIGDLAAGTLVIRNR